MRTFAPLKAFRFFATCLFIISSGLPAMPQISVGNLQLIPKIKNGVTFIVMQDPTAESSQPFIDVFKENWTISKIKFIRCDDLGSNIYADASYFMMWFKRYNDVPRLFLELWVLKEEFINGKAKRKISSDDWNQVGRIELFTDNGLLNHPDQINEIPYDGGGRIRNWSPGILKNYLQSLMTYLNKAEIRQLADIPTNAAELEILKNETLYVPDYVLQKFNKMSGKENKQHDEKELFDYKYRYKIVTMAELNQMILSNKEQFYYLSYVKSNTDKYVSVINSQTGEIVYSRFNVLSYNIKSEDLKQLEKAME